jgi:ectoine hydroxylase-related dioxygenase (phytanoyl-CoA dioxygenase family)
VFNVSNHRQRFDLLLELPAAVLTTIDSAWRSGVAEALGCDSDAMRVQVSAVYSRPGAPNQDWHSDGGHLDRDGGWGSGLPGECLTPARPYALCVFVPLVDLTAATGFTSFWPGSHRHAGLLGFGPAATALGAEVDGMVSAGTALAYDYRLLHRGRANVGDTQRELVQFLYSRDYIEAKNYGQTRLLS